MADFTARESVMPLSKNGVACMAYSAKGAWLASGGGDGKVCVWQRQALPGATAPAHIFSGHADRVTAVAFSPDDRWLISGAADNTIRVYDTKQWKEVAPLAPEAPLAGLALSPDGKLVATVDAPQNRLALWDARTGKQATPIEAQPQVASAAAFAPDGKTLALGVHGRIFDFWELPTGKKQLGRSFRESKDNELSIDATAWFCV